MENEEKVYSESRSLNITGDSFPKIIVRRDIRKRFYDENGILNIGLIDFYYQTMFFNIIYYKF